MAGFKVGDRVRCTSDVDGLDTDERVGTVTRIAGTYLVKFDDETFFIDDRNYKDQNGWWMFSYQMEPINDKVYKIRGEEYA